ncbi:MAG: hypothetical protein RSC55_00010 [Oscillospiraceae bacterium]
MKLFKKIVIFIFPFALIFALFVAFEPYDYWGLKGESRYYARSVSSLRELLREHPENIVLGDSRMANFNADYIEEIGGGHWTMLCYGGATLNENIEQFWFASEHTELKKVVIGLNFYNLSDIHYSEGRFESASEKALSPTKFFFDFDVWLDMLGNLEVALSNAWANITGNEKLRMVVDDPSSLTQDVRPPSDYSADGYRIDLQNYAAIIYSQCDGYKGALEYLSRLDEIIDYCDTNGIELVFIMPNSNRAIWDFVVYPMEIDFYINIYKDRLSLRYGVQ